MRVANIKKTVSISPAVLFDLKVSRQLSRFLMSNFNSWNVKWREKKKIPDMRIKI